LAYFKNSGSKTNGDLHAFVEFNSSNHGEIFAYVKTFKFVFLPSLMLSLMFLILNMLYVFQLNRGLLDCSKSTSIVDSKHGKSTKWFSK
jgi:hypothetical protein